MNTVHDMRAPTWLGVVMVSVGVGGTLGAASCGNVGEPGGSGGAGIDAATDGAGGAGGMAGGGGGAGGGGSGGGLGGTGGGGGVGGTGGDAGGGGGTGTPGQLQCSLVGMGGQTCQPGQICCAQFIPNVQFTCSTAASCPSGQSTFRCDGPEDCSSTERCCFHFALAADAHCRANCPAGDYPVCHSSATCPPAAPHCCTTMGVPSGLCVATPPAGATCN
jgi:hypothetical protein